MGEGLKVELDKRDVRSGEKNWGWIKKGIPLRLEVGMREIESGQLSLYRRDRPHKEATPFSIDQVVPLLEEIQANLLAKARAFRDLHTVTIKDKEHFYSFFTPKGAEIHGGFALAFWNGDPSIEAKVKEELGVSIRCIPLDRPKKEGKCIFTGENTSIQVIFAKAY
jgi:prolyl-tRNA synthetase